MIKKNLIAIISIAFIVSGCASIFTGSTQQVEFDSDPQGATVVIGKMKTKDGKKIMVDSYDAGVTPLVVELSRKKIMVEISKEGYETQEVQLGTTMNPWFLGNFIFGGVLGSSTDTSTGAINEYKPGKYMLTLIPE